MGPSLRSKRTKRNNTKLRNDVFAAVEAARAQRLSAKQKKIVETSRNGTNDGVKRGNLQKKDVHAMEIDITTPNANDTRTNGGGVANGGTNKTKDADLGMTGDTSVEMTAISTKEGTELAELVGKIRIPIEFRLPGPISRNESIFLEDLSLRLALGSDIIGIDADQSIIFDDDHESADLIGSDDEVETTNAE